MQLEKSKKTTIAIDTETSEGIDKYCRERGMLKMDFVRKAFHAIVELGIDLDSETLYMIDKEDKTHGVSIQPKPDDSLLQFNASFACLADNIDALTHALLAMPGHQPEIMAVLNAYESAANNRILELKNELFHLRNANKIAKDRIDQLLITIEKLKGNLSTAIEELQRSGLFKKPNKAVIDRLIFELNRISESTQKETTTTIYCSGGYRSV